MTDDRNCRRPTPPTEAGAPLAVTSLQNYHLTTVPPAPVCHTRPEPSFPPFTVIPAKAGIHRSLPMTPVFAGKVLDSRFRGNDGRAGMAVDRYSG